jgi:hypothetical protein
MEPNKTNMGTTAWTIMGIVIVVIIVVIIYAATQKSLKGTDMNSDNTALIDGPITTATPTGVLGSDRVAVTTTSTGLDVVNLQTFPYKVQAKVTTSLPDSCSAAVGSVTQVGKTFNVMVTASRVKDAVCAQVITSAMTTVDIPVAGLTAGTYTVKYGTFSKTFTLVQNNSIDYMAGDK